MKIVNGLLCALALTFSVQAETIRLSEPVAKDATTETFGVVLDTSLPTVSLKTLMTDSENQTGKPFQVETRISKVCQKKGCFFIAQQEQFVVRVSFRDYGFFIPTDSNGKTVVLAGELVQKEMSAEKAAHFKADLNTDDDIVKPGMVYEIIADSVTIPLS